MAKKKNKTKYIIGAVVIFAVLAIVLMLYENSGDISGQAIKATKVTSVARAGDMFEYVDADDISALNKREMDCAQIFTYQFANEYPSVKCAFDITEYTYSVVDDSNNRHHIDMHEFGYSCSYSLSREETRLGSFDNPVSPIGDDSTTTFVTRLLCACYTG